MLEHVYFNAHLAYSEWCLNSVLVRAFSVIVLRNLREPSFEALLSMALFADWATGSWWRTTPASGTWPACCRPWTTRRDSQMGSYARSSYNVFHMFLSPINLNKYSAISDKIVWMVYTHTATVLLSWTISWLLRFIEHPPTSIIYIYLQYLQYLLTVGSMIAWWTPPGDPCWRTQYPMTPRPPEGGML